ncbi:MAG TPA: D,D-heptose 1,7-bisphosphate phosphatase [Lachnospiraceae bacterium]|nr:D,D-heptose 1,7-bisphosphate phosphatase [Lachnospiraceae bacterium]
MERLRPAVFLDRDGTINIEKGYLYRKEDFIYLEGAVEGLRRLQDMGYLLVVITNQSGIARGYYSEGDLKELTDWMGSDLKEKGISIAGMYYCPHHPQAIIGKYRKACDCRKPRTGLFYRAAEDLRIDFEKSIAVGDRLRDLEICHETKVKGILLSESDEANEDIVVCRDWMEIVHYIESMKKEGSNSAPNI